MGTSESIPAPEFSGEIAKPIEMKDLAGQVGGGKKDTILPSIVATNVPTLTIKSKSQQKKKPAQKKPISSGDSPKAKQLDLVREKSGALGDNE